MKKNEKRRDLFLKEDVSRKGAEEM